MGLSGNDPKGWGYTPMGILVLFPLHVVGVPLIMAVICVLMQVPRYMQAQIRKWNPVALF